MASLLICPEEEAAALARKRGPSHVLSLSSPGSIPPLVPAPARLALVFHDIDGERPGHVAPRADAIADLVGFGGTWRGERPLLVHCRMGISRSTAAALILAAARRPERPEADIAAALRRAAPCATPNPLMIALADRLLGRDGRLVAAACAIGRGADYRPYRATELDAG